MSRENDVQNRETKEAVRGLAIGIAILGMVGLVTYMILMKGQISTLIYRKSNTLAVFFMQKISIYSIFRPAEISNMKKHPLLVTVNDTMQQGYTYLRTEPEGKNFDSRFLPGLTPIEMLEAGVFGGKYMTDCQNEFPAHRRTHAKLSPHKKDPKLNFFGVDASLSLHDRKEKGRIHPDDPRGRFQRYCRYYSGRRMPEEDTRQINRRRAIKRHQMAVLKNCYPMDWECRKKQRQALLHRAYDARKY